jgi:hypothetical protein
MTAARATRTMHAADAPRGRSVSRPSAFGPSGLGNQTLQSHLRSGTIRAKLEIGATNDPAEAEADRMADVAMRGPCACGGSGCASCGGGTIRRKEASSGAARSARADTLSLGAGRPLDRATSSLFGSRYGADLSRVRVHDDAQAAASAKAMGARAFTIGDDIGFADGAYDPSSESGKRLLAHELAHVMQGGSVVRREGDGKTPENDPAKTQTKAGPLKTEHTGDFNPCNVDVATLTNYALLAEIQNTNAYMTAHNKKDAFYDYANLGRKLAAERARRIMMGNTWMAAAKDTFPATVYRLDLIGNGSFTVSIVGGDLVSGAPVNAAASPLLTPEQFAQFLERNKIPQVNVEAFYARLDEEHKDEKLNLVKPPEMPKPAMPNDYQQFLGQPGRVAGMQPYGNAAMSFAPWGMYASPFDLMSKGLVSQRVYTANALASGTPAALQGAETNWRGDLPEYALGYGQYGSMMQLRDLNRVQPNFRIFDFIDRGAAGTGKLYSVTHSASGNMDWYKEKLARMAGHSENNKFNDMLVDLNNEYRGSFDAANINSRNYLAVPDDHVPLVRAEVAKLVNRGSPRIAPILDALLRAQPETVGGVSYSTWNQVQTARTAGLSKADYNLLLTQLTPRAQQRIVPIGMTMPQIMDMQQLRANTQNLGPGAFSLIAAPEVLELRRLVAGGMTREAALEQVTKTAGKRGLAMGAASVAVLDLMQYGMSGFDPHTGKSLLAGSPAQIGGTAAESYLMAQWNARMVAPALEEAIASGGSNAAFARVGAIRLGGGAAVGGPMAALTTWGQMGLQEMWGTDVYSGIDYAAKGTRALGVGALAAELGPLGFAGYCALAGTPEAPGVGTAIGFGIGLVAYFVIDLTIGDEIEKGVRDAMGEQGCKH